MTGIVALQDAIIAGLKERVPQLNSVAAVEGNITQDSIRRISVRSPAALVAIVGVNGITKRDVGIYTANATVAVFLFTAGKDRIRDAQNLTQAIILAALDSTWDVPHTATAMEVEADSLYDDDVTKQNQMASRAPSTGVLLTGISWKQRTRIERLAAFTVGARADDNEEAEALGKDPAGTFPESISIVETDNG